MNTQTATPRTEQLRRDLALPVATHDLAIDLCRTLEREVAQLRAALEAIMHARRNPASTVTDMSRAAMREIAAEALGLGSDETSKWQAAQS